MSPDGESSHKINAVEKDIIGIALLVSAVHLGLIAYAAIKLGIGVPSCVTNVKPFETGSLIDHGGHRYEAHILAKMWGFEPNKIYLPTGSKVDFYVTSKDVTHGFHIDGTNVNLMAEPFVVNEAQATFEQPGTYSVTCHEYCGAGHQNMNAIIQVGDDITEARAEGLPMPSSGTKLTSASESSVPAGRKVMQTYGCVACHSVDGAPGVGPTFKGIWGTKVDFTDGSSMLVDPAYIKMHIRKPGFKVVKGFTPVMPKLPVTDAEIDQVIEYIRTLK